MSQTGRRRKSEAGFTLVEMIIVVAIIAVLSAILSLSIRQIRASFALSKAATIATSEVRRAQAATVAEAVDYTVEFIVANPGSINVYQDTNGDKLYADYCTGPLVDGDGDGLVDDCIAPYSWVKETEPVRRVLGENWPPAVEITGGSLPNCGTAAGAIGVGTSGNRCVRFGFLGAPTAPGTTTPYGNVVLRSTVTSRTSTIVVEPGTGRVSAQ